jgi:hypothetical protein
MRAIGFALLATLLIGCGAFLLAGDRDERGVRETTLVELGEPQ